MLRQGTVHLSEVSYAAQELGSSDLMKVLFLAPQPCYVDRGTPIAVDLTIATLTKAGYEVDLLTFPGGATRTYPKLRTYRVGEWFTNKPVRAGFSAKKILLDVFMLFKALQLAAVNRYTLVHAVEESSFIALILRAIFRVPFIGDMDSRMTTQLTERYRWLTPLDKILWFIETVPQRFATSVVTMCESLRDEVLKVRSDQVFVVKDVSLLDYYGESELELPQEITDITARHNRILMYIGNLEIYQGISLMLNAFAWQRQHHPELNVGLVVVGGDKDSINSFRQLATGLAIEDHCYFVGPQPVGMLTKLMAQADVLVSPRVGGTNTPLKLYSYLDSGVPVLATNLETHTQVVAPDQALLCEPNPESMAAGMLSLLQCAKLRNTIAANAKQLVNEHHSVVGFAEEIRAIYRQTIGRPSTP